MQRTMKVKLNIINNIILTKIDIFHHLNVNKNKTNNKLLSLKNC